MIRRWGAAVALAILWASAALAQVPERYVFSEPKMGTLVTITVLTADSARARAGAMAAFVRIDTLNQRLSDYLSSSELSRLSRTAGSGEWVPVSGDLWAVLSESVRIAVLTEGRFDVTIGPLTRLWRWAARRGRSATEEERRKARTAVGYEYVALDATRQSVRLAKRGMRLDLGGIAKGYAADEVLKELLKHQLPYAVADVGGDIAVGSVPPDSTGWPVWVDSSATVSLANCAVAASGGAVRFVEDKGQRYSHILDAASGLGQRVDRTMVVFAPSAMEADALATAGSTMTAGEVAQLADRVAGSLCGSSAQQCASACLDGTVAFIVR